MVRNVSKEDISKLNGLLNQTLDEETVDYELSMLDEEDGEILSAFVVEKYRVPYEIGAEDDDDFYYNEVLGVYCKDNNEESLNKVFYETTAATKKMVFFWLLWTENDAEILSSIFIDDTMDDIRYLYRTTFPKITKYKQND